MLKQRKFTILFLSWVIFITTLSLFSFSGIDFGGTGILDIPYADKITHFVFYFIFAYLGCFFLRERSKGTMALYRTIWIVLFLGIGYGLFVEFLQYALTVDRKAEWGDVIANSAGAITGIGLIHWLFSKERPLKWKF